MEPNEISDQELIKAYVGNGDELAFGQLFDKYKQKLYWYLQSLLSGRAGEVDDLFQITWQKAIDRLPRYQEQGTFGAWLLRIGRNLVIDQARKRQRHPEPLSLDEENAPEVPELSLPSDSLERTDLREAINRALASLPPEQREVFELRSEDFSFDEIAKMQNCPVNTALGRMRYACLNLRKFLLAQKA